MNTKRSENQSLSEHSYGLLRKAILVNELRPESFWSDKELCAKFDLSRTPVREALLRLQTEQLVQIVPRKGTRVLPLAVDDVREIHQLAKALELEAALTIARIEDGKEAMLQPLLDSVLEMERTITSGDRDAWVIADEQFHHYTVDICGNKRLAEIYHAQRELTDRARYFALHLRQAPTQSTIEHRGMYEAILAGDLNEIERLYRLHWDRTTEELLAIIDRESQQSPFPKLAHTNR